MKHKQSEYHRFQKEWKSLLCDRRIGRDVSYKDAKVELAESFLEEYRHPFEADVNRIQFSAPFRRLAGKTQVHPFSEIDFIHNRLTHSVEVASVGRSLARRVGRFLLTWRGDLENKAQIDQLGWIAEAGGLAHDIGNPPYGHAGESAIREWAQSYRRQSKKNKELLSDDVWMDFEKFDGNAQAFRMLVRPDLRATSYFRLTAASLGALIKYPIDVSKADSQNPKFNCFSSEKAHFEAVMRAMGLVKGRSQWKRHPISYLTEAADDICYRISDFEDAVLMGLIPESEVREIFLQGLEYKDRLAFEGKALSHIRAKTISALIEEFAKQFENHYDEIMTGVLQTHDLKDCVSAKWQGIMAQIKEKYRTIFSQRKKVVEEIGCYSQINIVMTLLFGLLHELKNGIGRFDNLSFHSQRIVTLVWGREYFDKNLDNLTDWWAHAVLDYVAGMTDSYLDKLASELG